MQKICICLIILLFTACSNEKIKLNDYKSEITKKMEIPEKCKVLYKKKKARVAVMNFVDKSDTNNKFASSFVSSIENMLKRTGVVDVYERENYDKIDEELKFQDSGLLDPKSVVKFGKTKGIEYIITGSINYIKYGHKNYSDNMKTIATTSAIVAHGTKNENIQQMALVSALAGFGASFFNGTSVKSGLTIKIIDVASSKILFTKEVEGESKINSDKKASLEQVKGAVEEGIANSLEEAQSDFEKYFDTTGYISRIKSNGEEKIFKISLGLKEGVKVGDKFLIYSLEEFTHPLSGETICEQIPTQIVIQVSDNIENTGSWARVISGEEDSIKLLHIIKRLRK